MSPAASRAAPSRRSERRSLCRGARARSWRCWPLWLGLTAVHPAAAQAPADGPTSASSPRPREAIAPPRLVEFVQARYPAESLRQRLEGTVQLRLTIDSSGSVTLAEVIHSSAPGFEQAARDAALQFRFEPARRGDAPVPSRILYEYAFRLPEAPPPDEPERQPLQAEPAPTPPRDVSRRAAPRVAPPRPPLVAPAASSRAPAALAHEPTSMEVTVRGASAIDRLRESAEAVHVVPLRDAAHQSADMGEVLARRSGLAVQRSGGLGSEARLSLGGFTDDQIRFFVDGVPLEFSPFGVGVASLPVNLVRQVEVYRGVVPIRFAADALGGAVHFVTLRPTRGTRAALSHQLGSFGTHRSVLALHHGDGASGVYARVTGFLDVADNDYSVTVDVADSAGQLRPTRVRRFHDEYQARGGGLELGVVGRAWADRLAVQVFETSYDKDLQHDIVMVTPYGEAEYGERARGAIGRYDHELTDGLRLTLRTGYTRRLIRLVDVGEHLYDWFGQPFRRRPRPGEIESIPHDRRYVQHGAFLLGQVEYDLQPGQALRVSVAPTHTSRTGDERRQSDPEARDPLSAERRLFTQVTGVEYEADWLDDRLETVGFVKHYLQRARSEEADFADTFRRRDRDTQRWGFGSALRLRLTPTVSAKASYERTTRLPRPEEMFGNGVLIKPSLELQPETSHNANLGTTLSLDEPHVGQLWLELNGFLRDADDLVVLLGDNRFLQYRNVYSARSLGVELSGSWTIPQRFVELSASGTYQEFRNTSNEGTFGGFEGDRIPNRPYWFASGAVRLRLEDVQSPRDELSLTWDTRYVHSFFRGWESLGVREFKQVVPSQLVHSVALSYLVRASGAVVGSTLEAQNLTDERVFDVFGVQRPGRAFYFKGTLEL